MSDKLGEPEIKYENNKIVISIKIDKADFPIKKLFYFIAIPLTILTTILTVVLADFLNYIYKDLKEMDYSMTFTYYMQILGNVFCYFSFYLNFLIIRQKTRKNKFNVISRLTSFYYIVLISINLNTILSMIFAGREENMKTKEYLIHMITFIPYLLYFLLIDCELTTNIVAQIVICFLRIFSKSSDNMTFAQILSDIMTSVINIVFIIIFNKVQYDKLILDKQIREEQKRYEQLFKLNQYFQNGTREFLNFTSSDDEKEKKK